LLHNAFPQPHPTASTTVGGAPGEPATTLANHTHDPPFGTENETIGGRRDPRAQGTGTGK
jgi:hypothetical protein